MSKFKKGDRVVIVKTSNICYPTPILGEVGVIYHINVYDDTIIRVRYNNEQESTIFMGHGAIIVPEHIYNSSLYKIMNEMEE